MDNALRLNRLAVAQRGGFQEYRQITRASESVQTPESSGTPSKDENIYSHLRFRILAPA